MVAHNFIDITNQRFGKLTAISVLRKGRKTYWKCICDCGKETEVRGSALRNGGSKSCGNTGCIQTSSKFDLTNKKFGFLTALKLEIQKPIQNRKCRKHKQFNCDKHITTQKWWLCICDCGNELYVASTALRNGKTQSCGCKTVELGILNNTLPNNMALVNLIYYAYDCSATKRKFEFNLSKKQFIELIYNDCFYCGEKPQHSLFKGNGKTKEIYYNGIDRIDNSKGYIINNCVSCCKICNRAKSNISYYTFMLWIDSLIDFKKDLLNSNFKILNTTKEINHIYSVYKDSATKRKLEFSLSIDIFKELIHRFCFYCGSDAKPTLIKIYKNYEEVWYNGIDRVDNSQGYIKDNCVSCCRLCNRAKSNLPYNDFLLWLNKISKFEATSVAA